MNHPITNVCDCPICEANRRLHEDLDADLGYCLECGVPLDEGEDILCEGCNQ